MKQNNRGTGRFGFSFGHNQVLARQTGPLKISPDVKASFHQDILVLLHVGKGVMFISNRTGGRIWQALADHESPNIIAQKLSDDFGISLAIARAHLSRFLRDLVSHELASPDRKGRD